jgi:hypothetical protein
MNHQIKLLTSTLGKFAPNIVRQAATNFSDFKIRLILKPHLGVFLQIVGAQFIAPFHVNRGVWA